MGDEILLDALSLWSQAIDWFNDHLNKAPPMDPCRPTLAVGVTSAIVMIVVALRLPFHKLDTPASVSELSIELSGAAIGLAAEGPIALACIGWGVLGEQHWAWLFAPIACAAFAMAYARNTLLYLHRHDGHEGPIATARTSLRDWSVSFGSIVLGLLMLWFAAVLTARLIEIGGLSSCQG